mmetsp:Transcript_13503/g.42512  ORF Transcript_13503/g.42512 Transcript_13503/m.42512 type:complete len:275 (+) Transcript_13503:1425-2249(+)
MQSQPQSPSPPGHAAPTVPLEAHILFASMLLSHASDRSATQPVSSQEAQHVSSVHEKPSSQAASPLGTTATHRPSVSSHSCDAQPSEEHSSALHGANLTQSTGSELGSRKVYEHTSRIRELTDPRSSSAAHSDTTRSAPSTEASVQPVASRSDDVWPLKQEYGSPPSGPVIIDVVVTEWTVVLTDAHAMELGVGSRSPSSLLHPSRLAPVHRSGASSVHEYSVVVRAVTFNPEPCSTTHNARSARVLLLSSKRAHAIWRADPRRSTRSKFTAYS